MKSPWEDVLKRREQRTISDVLAEEEARRRGSAAFPLMSEAGANINRERRLVEAGVPVPEPRPRQTLLSKAFDILDRTSAAGRGVLMGRLKGQGWGESLRAGKEGFLGRGERTTGQDILKYAAEERGIPLAKMLQRTPAGRFIGGFAVDVLADPTTYMTLGTKPVIRAKGALATAIARELSQETGKRITLKVAERLADNALRGDIPVGRMGAAINRALGHVVDKVDPVETGFGRLTAAQQKLRARQSVKEFRETAEQAGDAATALRQQARQTISARMKDQAKDMRQTARAGVADDVAALRTQATAIEKQAKLTKDVDDAVRLQASAADLRQQARNLYNEKLKGMRQTARIAAADEAAPLAMKADELAAIRAQAKREASDAAKAARKIEPPVTPATIARITERPGVPQTTLRVLGRPILDITPGVNIVRTAAGALVERSPTLTRVVDGLGRMFSFNYTPLALKGVTRTTITEGKEQIARAARALPYAREKGMRDIAEIWHKAGVQEDAARMAGDVIEGTVTATPEAARAAGIASDIFAKAAARLGEMGIPPNIIDNYFTHLYKDPPEKVKAVLDKWRQSVAARRVPGATPLFTKKRTIPTMEVARKLGLTPIEDARQVTMVYQALTEQASVLQQMGNDLVRMGRGVVQEKNPGGWVNVTGTEIPALRGKWIHPEVHQALQNLYPVISGADDGLKLATGLLDSAVRAWKAMVLFRPAFHMRNFMGNVFLNMADGIFNPLRYPQAVAVLTDALPFVEIGGRQVPTKIIRELFNVEGLAGQGVFREALHGSTRGVTDEAARMLAALERGGFGKVSYWVRHPFETSRAIGEQTDSVSRMVNFLYHMNRGLSPTEAAKMTRKALFDYGELTKTEQAIRRGLVHFYPWTRKSMPRMVERLVGAPGLFTGAMHVRNNAINLLDVDEQNLPRWLRDTHAIPLWVNPQGDVHFLTLNLPLSELSRLHDPRNIQEAMREAVSMLTPLIIVPAQLAANRSILTGQPITEYRELGGPQMWRDYGQFALRQLGLPGEIARGMDEHEMRREYERQVAEGTGARIPPSERGWLERVGLGTVQSPARWAARAEYERGAMLDQAVRAARARDIDVPDADELPKMEGHKSIRDVLEKYEAGAGGGPLHQVLLRHEAREAGEPPTAIRRAVQVSGVGDSWGPFLEVLMQAESGGNPLARSPVWVDAQTGRTSNRREGPDWYQATGLFQLPPPLFKAYKAEGHDDIFNPLHNTLAAINYIREKYGHPGNIPNIGREQYRGF